MKVLNDLKYMLEEQVKEITKDGDISVKELECLDKAVDIIKDIETIEAMKQNGYEDEEGSYSMGRGSYNSSRGNNGYGNSNYGNSNYSGHMMPYDDPYMMHYDRGSYNGSYDDMGSYRRGRSPRTGRYIRMNQYSRDEKKEEMIEKLEDMMNESQNDKDRMAIQKCIEKLEHEM